MGWSGVRFKSRTLLDAFVISLPWIAAAYVWLSALAFVPVPWPDDSAFYFVGRDALQWPPRWVMLPQAPFEPTYRIWNFNTMPLYPLLLGLGRLVGIDGSFALKFWPLSAWAASGSLLAFALLRFGFPRLLTALVILAMALDPVMRWASVLVRPESLIGLAGMGVVLGLTFGYPSKWRTRKFWDPTAALLAIGAYSHFNAVHILFAVVIALIAQPRRLFEIGSRCALYLVPWLITVAAHHKIFFHQMRTQWNRLAVPNGWLESPSTAVSSLFQDMGSPEPWPEKLRWAGVSLWLLILLAITVALTHVILSIAERKGRRRPSAIHRLAPSAGWVIGAMWLWHSKPEVWFVYYLHLATLTFAAILGLELYRASRRPLATAPAVSGAREQTRMIGTFGMVVWALALLPVSSLFGWVDVTQARRLAKTKTWSWDQYHSFVQCIDDRLSQLERDTKDKRKGPLQAWFPTFPDVTIEMARRHPEWQLTRTNDFWDRNYLAVQHGHNVDAVVVTETLNWAEREISAPVEENPGIISTWMTWTGYYLHLLPEAPGWKPTRYLCQRGRWQAFIFMEAPRASAEGAVSKKLTSYR